MFKSKAHKKLGSTTVLALMLAIGLGTGNLALAVPITFSFSGDVNFVDSALTATFNTNQLISGSYTFESTTPDKIPGTTNHAQYALTALSFNIDGYSVTGGMSSGAFISPCDGCLGDGLTDLYSVQNTNSLTGANVATSVLLPNSGWSSVMPAGCSSPTPSHYRWPLPRSGVSISPNGRLCSIRRRGSHRSFAAVSHR